MARQRGKRTTNASRQRDPLARPRFYKTPIPTEGMSERNAAGSGGRWLVGAAYLGVFVTGRARSLSPIQWAAGRLRGGSEERKGRGGKERAQAQDGYVTPGVH